MKFNMDLSKFKKISRTKGYTEMEHPDGHRFTIQHYKLHPKVRKALDDLPMHESSKPQKLSQGGAVASKDDVPEPDQKKAAAIQKGALSSGYDPATWKKNLKEGLGLAHGGMITSVGKENYKNGKGVQHFYEGGAPIPVSTSPSQVAIPESLVSTARNPEQLAQEQADSLPYGVTQQDVAPPAPAVEEVAVPQEEAVASSTPGAVPVMPVVQANNPPSAVAAPVVAGPKEEGATEPGPHEGYNEQLKGKQQAASLESQQAHANEATQRGKVAALLNLKTLEDESLKRYTQRRDELYKAMNKEPDKIKTFAERAFKDKGILGKIGSAIAIIAAGGAGGVLGTGNVVIDHISKEIEREVEAQKAARDQTMNLYKMNESDFQDSREAALMSKAQLSDIAAAQMEQQAYKTADPMAKARLLQASGELKDKYAPEFQKEALRKALSSGAADNMDPAQLVSQLVPKEHQEAVYKEVERGKNTAEIAPKILSAYDQVAKLYNNPAGRASALFHNPRALEGFDALIGTTVSDLEGTVRQAAMDNIRENLAPRKTDTAADLAKRRDYLVAYLTAKQSAPRFKDYVGRDLKDFKAAQAAPPEIRTGANGLPYQRVNGGWKRIK